MHEGLGYTILPSCGVLSLVKEGKISACPVEGLHITWTVARPLSVGMNVTARLLLDVIFQVVEETVTRGAWPMAQLAKNCALETRTISKRKEPCRNCAQPASANQAAREKSPDAEDQKSEDCCCARRDL